MNDRNIDPSKFFADPEYQGVMPVGASGATRQQPAAPSQFMTGQNLQGTRNGWDTGFLNSFYQNYSKSLNEGGDTLNWFRDKKDGIALWDDPEAGIKFGDVFRGGQKVENLYVSQGQEAADAVMRSLTLSATEQANGVSVEDKKRAATQAAREQRAAGDSKDARFYQNQAKFQADVQAEKDSWNQDEADTLTWLGGAAGGAVTGAGTGALIGTLFGPGGSLVGGAIGGVLGAIGGAVGTNLNRDEVQDAVARAEVQAEYADKEGWGSGLLSKMANYGGVAGQLMNPAGQLLHGAAEVAWGESGDDQSAFYEVDDAGQLKRSGWWTAADVGASLASAVGQFGTGAGAVAFQAQMGAQILGKTGQLISTGGQTWDDAGAEYDNIFLDSNGNFSALTTAAGLGSIGIDVVQLGMARGVMSRAGQLGRGSATGLGSKLTGTSSGAAAGTGATRQTLGGHSFLVENGVAQSHRISAAALAPSEFVQYGATRVAALVSRKGRAGAAGGKLGADELYQAALKMESNGRVLAPTVINATGEAMEEMAQTALEPLSHERSIDTGEMLLAGAHGAAMGAGMTMGSRAYTTSKKQREVSLALKESQLLGEGLTREQLEKMSDQERAAHLAERKIVEEILKPVEAAAVKEQRHAQIRNDPTMQVALERQEKARASAMESANPATDRMMVATLSSPPFEDHKVQLSLRTLEKQWDEKINGLEVQIANAKDDTQKQLLESVAAVAAMVGDRNRARTEEFYVETTTEDRRAEIVQEINREFDLLWQVKPNDPKSRVRAMAASLLVDRNPIDNPNSVVLLLPQVSLEDSMPRESDPTRGRGDNMLQVSEGIAAGMGLDYDGDKLVLLNRLILDEDLFRSMRTGVFMRTQDTTSAVAIATSGVEKDSIEVLAESLRQPLPTQARAIAENALQELGDALSLRYGTKLDADQFILELQQDLRAGRTDAKQAFLTKLATLRESDVQEMVQDSWTNEWLWINSRIRKQLWDFQRSLSAAGAKELGAVTQKGLFAPVTATSQAGRVRGQAAATMTQRLWLLVSGDNLFRKWQSLQYSSVRSPETEEGAVDPRDVFEQMSQMYAATNSGLAGTKLDLLQSKDRMTRNVLRRLDAWLAALQREQPQGVTSIAVLAGMSVPRFDKDATRILGEQSVVQWLLREEVLQERIRQGQAMTVEFEQTLNRLNSMDAHEAFVHVLGPLQTQRLLGLDADVFGGTLTLDQVLAKLVNQDSFHRQQTERMLRSHVAYDNSKRKNLPLRLELEDGSSGIVSPYQVVVDALVETANKTLSYDSKEPVGKQLRGRVATSSAKKSEEWRTAVQLLWSEMAKVKGLDRSNRVALEQFLHNSPRIMRSYLGMLSENAMAAAVDLQAGTAQSWIIDSLMQKTPEAAEMMFWRNMKLAEWNALGVFTKEAEWKGRSVYDLTDRWHLLMYRLARMDSQIPLAKFEAELLRATNLDEFIAWVNNQDNLVRMNEAPYTAWNSDIAELDPTAVQGEIQSALPGAQVRQAISEFHTTVVQLTDTLRQEERLNDIDTGVLVGLRKALDGSGTPAEKGLLQQLEDRLKFVREFRGSLGPAGFFQAALGNLLTPTEMTDKGKAAGNVAPIGALDMMMFMREFGTPEEARLNSLTSNSLTEVMRNPTVLLDPMDLMDDNGNRVDWAGLDAKQLVKLFAVKENRPLLRLILSPSVWEPTEAGNVSQRAVLTGSLQELLATDTLNKALFDDDIDSKMLNLSMIDGLSESHDALKYAMTLSTVLASQSKNAINAPEQAARHVTRAATWTVDLVRQMALLAGIPDGGDVDTVDEYGKPVTRVAATALDRLRYTVKTQLRGQRNPATRLAAEQGALLIQLAEQDAQKRAAQSPGDTTAILEQLDTDIELVTDMLNHEVLPRLLAAYSLEPMKATKNEADWMHESVDHRSRIWMYVNDHGSLLAQAPWSAAVLEARRQDEGPDKLPALSRAHWEELARVVVAHALQNTGTTTSTNVAQAELKSLVAQDLKYFDPSYSFLLDDLMDSTSPLIKGQRRLLETFNLSQLSVNPAQVLELLDRTLLKPGLLGPLTDTVSVNILQARTRVDGAAAGVGIAGGGQVTKNHAVENIVTARTDGVPPEALLSQMALRADDLARRGPAEASRPGAGGTTLVDFRLLDGRFIRNLRVVDSTGAEVTSTRTNPFLRNSTVYFTGTERAATSGYKALRVRRLQQAIEGIAADAGVPLSELSVEFEMFHPDDQPLSMPNNLFFEGVVGEGDTAYLSLSAASLNSPGGWAQTASTRALESAKKARSAINRAEELSKEEKRALTVGWETDLAETLRTMALRMFDPKAMGAGETMPEFHLNSMVKKLQVRHVVRVKTGPNSYQVLSFEEAREQQRAGTVFDPATAELVQLSTPQVAMLYGDPDRFTNPTVAIELATADIFDVQPWTGKFTNKHKKRLPGLFSPQEISLFDARYTGGASLQKRARFTGHASDQDGARAQQLTLEAQLAADIHRERMQLTNRESVFAEAQQAALEAGLRSYTQRSLDEILTAVGFPTSGSPELKELARGVAVQDMVAWGNQVTTRLPQVYNHTAQPGRADRRIGQIYGINGLSRSGKPQPAWVAPHDPIVLNLDSFKPDDFDGLEKALTLLMSYGADVILTPRTANRQLLAYARDYLYSGEYDTMNGTPDVFVRSDIGRDPATVVALFDKLTEMGPVHLAHVSALLHTTVYGGDENSGVVLRSRFGRRQIAATNLLPLAGYGFGLVAPSQLAQVKAKLLHGAEQLKELNLENDAAYQKLLKKGDTKSAARRKLELDTELQRALTKLHNSLQSTGLYPEGDGTLLEMGDIIPLYDASTDQLVLYRHGFKPPTPADHAAMLAKHKTVLYLAEADPKKTANKGEIIRFQETHGGLSVELRVDIQDLGGKMVLDNSGFKILMKEMPAEDKFEMPELFSGVEIDGLLNPKDALGKNNYAGRIDNFQDAFAYLGIDFRPELARAFFGDDSAARQAQVVSYLNQMKDLLPQYDKRAVNQMMKDTRPAAALLDKLHDLPNTVDVSKLVAQLQAPVASPEARIALAVLNYLSWTGGQVEDVLRSPGIGAPNIRQAGVSSWRMPALFTQVFENTGKNDPLRQLMFQKLNDRFPNAEVTADGRRLGYTMHPDFTVSVSNKDPKYNTTGWLQFAVMKSAPLNPVTDEAAADRTARQGVAMQLQQVFGGATGGRTAIDDNLTKMKARGNRQGITNVDSFATLYRMLRDVKSEPMVRMLPQHTPGEAAYVLKNREAAADWRRPLKQVDWDPEQKAAYAAARAEAAYAGGLDTNEAELLDTFVRQHTGAPTLSKKQLKNLTMEQVQELTRQVEPTFEDAMLGLKMIKLNFDNGMLPTTDAANPQIHMLDLAQLYKSSQASGRFGLRRSTESGEPTNDWAEWVHIALAIGDVENQSFDLMFLPAVDAMRQSYLDSGLLFSGIPVSASSEWAQRLADPESFNAITVSPERAKLLQAPEFERVAWFQDPTLQAAVKERQRSAYHWRKTHTNGAVPMNQTLKDLVVHGTRLVDNGSRMTSVLQVALHLRAMNALLNPALLVGAPFEAGIQTILEDVTNLLTGDSTGLLGQTLNKVITTATGNRLSISPYTREQVELFRQSYRQLGDNQQFKSMVYTEFKMDSDPHGGALTRLAHKGAEFAGKIQDPYYLMPADLVARRYMETVFRGIHDLGSNTALTSERVALEMRQDPLWVQKELPALHMMAMNAVKNVKSLKATTASVAWRSFLDPLTSSPRSSVATFSTLFLRLPFMFANYGFNTAVRILGLQGIDSWIAAMLSGREKGAANKIFTGMVDAVAGSQRTTVEGEDIYDFGEVLESIDISHAFMKSSLSLTSLFAFGLLAGSMGLTGEDDEDRRRRRAAEFQGVPYLYDPRDIANDFRNADALYMDQIPLLSEWFKVTSDEEGLAGRSMAQMNFVVKQVASPVLGIQRFLSTGNPMEVLWGFEDAVSSLPLVKTMFEWENAATTYTELMSMAGDKAKTGNPEDLPEAMRLMLSAVMTLERMLLENNFVNQVYIALDRFDRDPYAIVQKDAEGNTVTNQLGMPERATATEPYRDENGELQEGWLGKDWLSAYNSSMSENRFTWALLNELTTLGKADAFRQDMVVKTRKIGREEITYEEAREAITYEMADGVVRAMWKGGMRPEDLHLDGFYMSSETRSQLSADIKKEIFDQAKAAGLSDSQANWQVTQMWSGSRYAAGEPTLEDIVWSKGVYEGSIPWKQSTEYAQLNTTYIKGPDGKFWATGVSRRLWETFASVAPFSRYLASSDTGLPSDSRLNTVDDIRGLNTGMRGLVRIDESWDIPEDAPLSSTNAATGNSGNSGNGWVDFGNKKSGWRNFGRRSGGGGGGGSFTRLNPPQDSQTPYANSAQNASASNPIIRRGTIRRERSDSEKGRLKPWQ